MRAWRPRASFGAGSSTEAGPGTIGGFARALPTIFQRTACTGLDTIYRFAFTGRARCTLPP